MAEIAVIVASTWTCGVCGWESGPIGRLLPQSPLVVDDIRLHIDDHISGERAVGIAEMGEFRASDVKAVMAFMLELDLTAGCG